MEEGLPELLAAEGIGAQKDRPHIGPQERLGDILRCGERAAHRPVVGGQGQQRPTLLVRLAGMAVPVAVAHDPARVGEDRALDALDPHGVLLLEGGARPGTSAGEAGYRQAADSEAVDGQEPAGPGLARLAGGREADADRDHIDYVQPRPAGGGVQRPLDGQGDDPIDPGLRDQSDELPAAHLRHRVAALAIHGRTVRPARHRAGVEEKPAVGDRAGRGIVVERPDPPHRGMVIGEMECAAVGGEAEAVRGEEAVEQTPAGAVGVDSVESARGLGRQVHLHRAEPEPAFEADRAVVGAVGRPGGLGGEERGEGAGLEVELREPRAARHERPAGPAQEGAAERLTEVPMAGGAGRRVEAVQPAKGDVDPEQRPLFGVPEEALADLGADVPGEDDFDRHLQDPIARMTRM